MDGAHDHESSTIDRWIQAEGAARRRMRAAAPLAGALVLALALLLALAARAGAQSGVQGAADALKGDPVYVDPDAELAGQVDAAALRARIESAGAAPMFIAVLPASDMSSSAGRTLVALRQAVGRDGTYALAVGDEFRTLSDHFDAAPAGDAARAAHPDDLQATLIAFVDRTGREHGGGSSSSGGALASILVVVLLLAVAAGGAFLLVSRRRSRGPRDGQSEVGQIDQSDEFVRLGDSIRALELDVTLGDADSAAKADYDRAVEAYGRANEYNRKGATTAANQALDEGLAHIASARERLAGRR
jgi:hypothetical protein